MSNIDSPTESIVNSKIIFKTSKVSLYKLPYNHTSIKDFKNGYNLHLPEPIDLNNIKDCIWRGSIRLLEEEIEQQPLEDTPQNIIEPFSKIRAKLEFINIINEDIEKLWGETWYIPVNRNIESEIESNSQLLDDHNIITKYISKISNDGTDSIKLVRDTSNYSRINWYRIIVQIPGTGFLPIINQQPPTTQDAKQNQDITQVALLLKFNTSLEAEIFNEKLDDFAMKFEDQESSYYNEKWESIINDDGSSATKRKPIIDSDSDDFNTRRLTQKYHDMILKEASKMIERKQQRWKKNNDNQINHSSRRVKDSSDNSSTTSDEEDDFGDFVSN
ncbi:hypothetical protein KGF54_003895 [Candida jiufengensis]|uniref:uncharacterized protein n=1 Tax=Candida jiufengensis TaxID=497108 RepID=UPI0022257C59|nr:uncharacterized protein KGF54_003895 [Candida jiufengensis]KAI5950821.1 hypothetical protein KGF54_003895 [Candida jiufengensis]